MANSDRNAAVAAQIAAGLIEKCSEKYPDSLTDAQMFEVIEGIKGEILCQERA